MDAKDTLLTDFLDEKAQFRVPIYQRKYSWKMENCRKLVDDILKVARDTSRPCHFIGSIIYLARADAMHASAVKEYFVIDGQQRLTTLSILLLALGDYTRKKIQNDAEYDRSATCLEALSEDYLINRRESGDLYYKLRLNEEDFEAWKRLLRERKKPDEIGQSKIFENYNILYRALEESDAEPQLIFDGIKKLRLVDICLIPEDNAQLVFETVNSTGLPLTTADKIRNFLLMTVKPDQQEQLYRDYWHPMEQELGMESGESEAFNSFFHYYMTAMLQRPLFGDYYEQFKDYYYSYKNAHPTAGAEEIVQQIRQYSKFYQEWIKAPKDGTKLQKALYRVRKTGQWKITPVVLKLLEEEKEKVLSEEEVIEILQILESYWMRRSICFLPTNTAGSVCLSILKRLSGPDPRKAFKEMVLKELTWSQRMPNDAEVKRTLKTLELYALSRERTKMILDTLENHGRKEAVPTKEYTIEHIMPQTLSKEWVADLGAEAERVHETYLHTLGNLTLTGYNSEYQNKRFSEKMDCTDREGNAIGYRHTPIRISASLTKETKWGEAEILKRTEALAEDLLRIWKYPQKD